MKYGLIAEKLGHSFSPEIHQKLFGYTYELKEIAKEQLDSFMKTKGFLAINVTIPYKQSVIPYLDFIDETAEAIGAVNTVVNKNGALCGYNTDILGLVSLINQSGIELKNKKVLVLGSGGTSKTAVFASKQLGCSSVLCVSRTGKDGCITYDQAAALHSDADVLINTTPSGMFPNINESPIDIDNFKNLSGVVDVVYNPLKTKLVCDALKKGIKATGGLYMLVAQAAYAARLFVEKTVEESKIKDVYNQIKSSKQNVVLIGMPSSGKSTVGKILASKLGFEFIDTDNLITQKTSKSPAGLINNYGEKYFRDIESEVIKDISAMQSKVIATGGGAVLRNQNIDLLRQNGYIIFLDRAFNDLIPDINRPLSSDSETLKKLYDQRHNIYISCCDSAVNDFSSPETTAELILKELRI